MGGVHYLGVGGGGGGKNPAASLVFTIIHLVTIARILGASYWIL